LPREGHFHTLRFSVIDAKYYAVAKSLGELSREKNIFDNIGGDYSNDSLRG
jgi:hypothetical protein